MKRWKRIPRGWKIALDCIVVLLLLFILWALEDYPMPTARLAFRRAAAGVGCDRKDPELLVDLEYDKVEYSKLNVTKRTIGLLTDGDRVLRIELYQESGWKSWDPLPVPAADGVLYTPLPGWGDSLSGNATRERIYEAFRGVSGEAGPCDVRVPAFAVKAPGADATLTLTLKDCESVSGKRTDRAGPFPLVLQEQRDGWFIFRWDSLDLIDHFHEGGRNGGFDEPYEYLIHWIETYRIQEEYRSARATLSLTTRDEAGNVLEQRSWELP